VEIANALTPRRPYDNRRNEDDHEQDDRFQTVERSVERMNQLNEQGADFVRIGDYAQRWRRWARSGLDSLPVGYAAYRTASVQRDGMDKMAGAVTSSVERDESPAREREFLCLRRRR